MSVIKRVLRSTSHGILSWLTDLTVFVLHGINVKLLLPGPNGVERTWNFKKKKKIKLGPLHHLETSSCRLLNCFVGVRENG